MTRENGVLYGVLGRMDRPMFLSLAWPARYREGMDWKDVRDLLIEIRNTMMFKNDLFHFCRGTVELNQVRYCLCMSLHTIIFICSYYMYSRDTHDQTSRYFRLLRRCGYWHSSLQILQWWIFYYHRYAIVCKLLVMIYRTHPVIGIFGRLVRPKGSAAIVCAVRSTASTSNDRHRQPKSSWSSKSAMHSAQKLP